MNCTVDGITDELQRLVSKLEKREATLDAVRELIWDPFANQFRCLEDLLPFEEFSKCVKSHPRGWLISSLAAENKELEQLQLENRTLLESLDKHECALDLIMKKYRSQVSQLMGTKRIEYLVSPDCLKAERQTVHLPLSSSSEADLVRAEPVRGKPCSDNRPPTPSEVTQAVLTARVSTIASMVKEVCDRGDAYTSHLEAELNRLRLENAKLRETLMISSDNIMDVTDMDEADPSTDPVDLGSTSMQLTSRSGLSVLPPNRNSCNVATRPVDATIEIDSLMPPLDELTTHPIAQSEYTESNRSLHATEDMHNFTPNEG